MKSYSSSFIVSILVLITMLASPAHSAPCNSSCGNITNIGFPFSLNNSKTGVDTSCPSSSYMDNPNFQLVCNETESKLYALHETSNFTALEVISIHDDSLIVRLADPSMGRAEMTPNGSTCDTSRTVEIKLPPVPTGPYVISDENKFGSFGCSLGILETTDFTPSGYSDHVAVEGCSVLLPDNQNNADCGNRTCCVSSLPPATDLHLRYAMYYTSDSLNISAPDPDCSNCSKKYASLFYPNLTDFGNRSFPIKIMWAFPVNMTTDPTSASFEKELNDTILKSPHYACTRDNSSDFIPVPELPGYLCKCKIGFVGDGYTNGTRCTDVDECKYSSPNPCVSQANCENSIGSYTCRCNSRFKSGDGRNDGSGCKLSSRIHDIIIIVPACTGFLIVLLIIMVFVVFWVKRMKRKYFIQNGGLLLQEFMKSKGHDHTRIFTGSELKVATNNYAEDTKLGSGGSGAVYKGELETGKLVAIKKALIPGDGDNKEFLNEVMILTKIHHKHIVKLLGCCLETKTPLLVYEYASNGTLHDHLHGASKNGNLMAWNRRLVVAIQTAEALSYLHRAASPPILHRDVKAANILLDHNWNAKVGDFGVSRLIPDGEEYISTAVQGTLGYLDPEYFQTLQLTDKSDVYSLGVMLVELITSLKPVDTHHRDPQFSNLALLFIHHMKEGSLEEIIDPRNFETIDESVSMSHEQAWRIRSSILDVASLAHRCLALVGHDRPSMMEVEHELHENSRKLHATRFDDVLEESIVLLQSRVAGAVIMENNEYVIHSNSPEMDGSKIYGISTQLPPR